LSAKNTPVQNNPIRTMNTSPSTDPLRLDNASEARATAASLARGVAAADAPSVGAVIVRSFVEVLAFSAPPAVLRGVAIAVECSLLDD
jgi:hypothetical protein